MSRSLSGLTEGIFSEIDVLDTISIDGNAGTQGQVLTTDGTNCDWQDITIADGSITNAMLTANCVEGDNILSGAIIESKLGTGMPLKQRCRRGCLLAYRMALQRLGLLVTSTVS